jgi:hypothetical protein
MQPSRPVRAATRPAVLTVLLQVKISREANELLKRVANKNYRTRSQEARLALERHLRTFGLKG